MASETVPYSFAARLATFQVPVHLAKRRASNAKKKQPATVSWPHTTPTPEQLARAGFYYKPSGASPDSVTCFLCKKSLDGWDPDDNPAVEHLSHVPDCGWAVCMGIELRSQDPEQTEDHPFDSNMADARKATFGDRWPHEGKKGWKCKVQKMVDAGWSYDPLPEADDCVKCFYCGVCLDGWEPKDDPWDEHQRRSPDCQFFKLVGDSKPATKTTKRTAPRASRASRSSRLSAQLSIDIEFDTHISTLSEMPDDNEEGDTIMSVSGTKRKVPKTRKRASTVTKSARSKRQPIQKEPMTDSEAMLPAESPHAFLDISVPDIADSSRKPTRTKAVTKKEQLHEDVAEASPAVARDSPAQKKKIARKPVKAAKINVDLAEQGSEVHVEALPVDKPQTNNLRKKKKALEDSVVMDSSDVVADGGSSQVAAPRATRGKKRMSDGTEKHDVSVIVPEDHSVLLESTRPTARPHISPVPHHEVHAAPPEPSLLPLPLRKVRKPASAKTRGSLAESDALANGAKRQSVRRQSAKGAAGKDIPAATSPERSPSPEQPLPEELVAETVAEVATLDAAEDSDSLAQSSNAENRPPSARTSLVAGDVKVMLPTPRQAFPGMATPLAQTPTKLAGTSKGLQTSAPWDQVNLDTVFILSPSSNARGTASSSLGQTLQNLSEAEKQMSVEDWILWNAKTAEERLRGECERLINVFENEGARALKSVEGIECI